MNERRSLMARPGLKALWRRAGLLGVVLLAGCGEKSASQAPAAAAPPPAVTVVTTRLADITPTFGFNGRVVAEDKVDLRARVSGFLQKREFTEGADVKVGRASVRDREGHSIRRWSSSARPSLPVPRPTGSIPQVALRRGEELVKNKNIPQAEVDQRRANDEMAAAEDPGGAGGAQAGRDQPRLHRHIRADRRPDRARERQRRQSGRARQRRSGDHRQPEPDLRDLPGQPAPAARVSARAERQRAPAGGQGRPAGRHPLPASGQPQLPRRPGRSGHRHGHGAGRPCPIPTASWSTASS